MIWITGIGSTCLELYAIRTQVKEGKLKICYERENKENQSNNVIKQTDKMKKTKQKEEKLKNTNKRKDVKVMKNSNINKQ